MIWVKEEVFTTVPKNSVIVSNLWFIQFSKISFTIDLFRQSGRFLFIGKKNFKESEKNGTVFFLKQRVPKSHRLT